MTSRCAQEVRVPRDHKLLEEHPREADVMHGSRHPEDAPCGLQKLQDLVDLLHSQSLAGVGWERRFANRDI